MIIVLDKPLRWRDLCVDMADTTFPQGGLTLADIPGGSTPPPAANPTADPQASPAPSVDTQVVPPLAGDVPVASAPPQPASEAFVVPPATTAPSNPFIPQGVVPEGAGTPPPGGGITPANPMPKRLIMIGAAIALIAVLFFIGRFVLGFIQGSQPVTITYWGLWENDAVMQSVIGDFEAANPKIKVQYVKQSNRQYRERLQAAVARGEGPDVFRFHNTWIYMLRSELLPAPAEIMSASEFSSLYYPVASNDLVGGQSVYGVPIMIDGLGLYYNEDLFAAAGVTPPTTWEDVLNLVPKLTVKNDTQILTSAIALGTTGNVENFSDILALMMMQNGAKLITPTGPQAEEALIFYRKFATPSDPVYSWNDTMDNSIYAFASGKVAMILAPSWRAFDIAQISPDLRFKIVPVPQLPGSTVTWASYWVEGVSAKSKYPEQSWAFIKYLTDKESVTKLYTEASKTRLFGEPYARVDMASALSEDPYVGAYIKQAQTAKSFPLASRTFDNGLNDGLIKYLTDAVNGVAQGSAPTAVLETASAGFSQVLQKYGLVSAAPPSTTQ